MRTAFDPLKGPQETGDQEKQPCFSHILLSCLIWDCGVTVDIVRTWQGEDRTLTEKQTLARRPELRAV